jgi:hypothetical protein
MSDFGEPEYLVNGKHPWNSGDKHKTFIEGIITQTFPDGAKGVVAPTWEDIRDCKKAEEDVVVKDYKKLSDLNVEENIRSFAGNKVIYHFFVEEMLKTRYKNGKTLQERWEADAQKMWEQVCKMDRCKAKPPTPTDVFELNRAITFFKPSVAKHIYQRFKATSVLDPCAGWGGRMLGAMALDIKYLGFDTNTNLVSCYEEMDKLIKPTKEGIWSSRHDVINKSCLDVDFKGLSYDCVLTSPPYYDLEIYPHQADLGTEEEWYRNFLMKMIARAYGGLSVGGHCCINISPNMYEKMVGYGFPKCQEKIDFLQQKNTAQWGEGKGKQDFIYVWDKHSHQ